MGVTAPKIGCLAAQTGPVVSACEPSRQQASRNEPCPLRSAGRIVVCNKRPTGCSSSKILGAARRRTSAKRPLKYLHVVASLWLLAPSGRHAQPRSARGKLALLRQRLGFQVLRIQGSSTPVHTQHKRLVPGVPSTRSVFACPARTLSLTLLRNSATRPDGH